MAKNKIVLLMPALMLDYMRDDYNKALDYALEHYGVDKIVIFAQAFQDMDYRDDDRIEYIGKLEKGLGIMKARNGLLNWFYDSEYEWAVCMDSCDKISLTTINDFRTVIEAIKNDQIEVDAITSTFGQNISGLRIAARAAEDHLENIKLVASSADSESHYFQGLFMRNFNKVYGMRVMVDETLDIHNGATDDLYYVLLLRRLFDVRQCPTIVFSVPSGNRASTWMQGDTRYAPAQYAYLNWLITTTPYRRVEKKTGGKTYVIPRVEYMRHKVTTYKPRRKKSKGGLL